MGQISEADKRYLFDKQKDLSEKLQKVRDQAASHKVYISLQQNVYVDMIVLLTI